MVWRAHRVGRRFPVKASGALLLAQGIDCEPTLALAVSADDG